MQQSTPSPFRFARPKPDADAALFRKNVSTPTKAGKKGQSATGNLGKGKFKTIVRRDHDSIQDNGRQERLEAREPNNSRRKNLDDGDQDRNEDAAALNTHSHISKQGSEQTSRTQDEDSILHSIKRPRLEPQPRHLTTHTGPTIITPAKKHIQAPTFNTTPQFRNFSSASPNTSTQRPRFVLPSEETAAANATPLPLAFSPHRSRDKERFVQGGWASQVRSWVFDIVADTSADEMNEARAIIITGVSITQSGGNADACAIVKGQIHKNSAHNGNSAHLFSQGRVNDDVEVEVMLIGRGVGNAAVVEDSAATKLGELPDLVLQVGTTVRLGPPCWEVEIAGDSMEGGLDGLVEMKKLQVCAGWKVT